MEAISQTPIACCLAAGEYKDRIAWIEQLTRRALVQHTRDDLTLILTYASDAASDVRKMVEQERICCPFLDFTLDERGGAVTLRITAPETARESADTLLQPFLNGA